MGSFVRRYAAARGENGSVSCKLSQLTSISHCGVETPQLSATIALTKEERKEGQVRVQRCG